MISWVVDVAYFIPLAKEFHGIAIVQNRHFTEYLRVWAAENNCVFHSPNNMTCSEEDFTVFKLKGCVLRELEQMKVIVDEYYDWQS